MTYEELENLVLDLPPTEAVQLLLAVVSKLESSPAIDATRNDAANKIRESMTIYAIEREQQSMEARVRLLIERLTHLPAERQAEVENFIEFLHQQELAQAPTKGFSFASEKSFARIWDNDDDALYDKL